MEIKIQHAIWEIDTSHGLAKKEKGFWDESKRDRAVLVEPNFKQIHDSFEEAVKEITEKGDPYTEYTILLRVYKTN